MSKVPRPLILAFKLGKIEGQSFSGFSDIATLNAAGPIVGVS